jgi:hypothetical protein
LGGLGLSSSGPPGSRREATAPEVPTISEGWCRRSLSNGLPVARRQPRRNQGSLVKLTLQRRRRRRRGRCRGVTAEPTDLVGCALERGSLIPIAGVHERANLIAGRASVSGSAWHLPRTA